MSRKISFAPLEPDAVAFLMARTGIDYRHCDFTGPQWLCATSHNKEGIVDGVFIGEFWTWFEVHFTAAVGNPRIVTHRLLRAIFTALFSRAVRITAQVRPENERANKNARQLGFQFEGFQRFAIDGKWDANLYGMVKPECKWLQPSPASTLSDIANRLRSDAIPVSQPNESRTGGLDFANLSDGQLGLPLAFATRASSMPDHVSLVFGNGAPEQMSGIDTAEMAISADVPDMSLPRRLSVNFTTNDSMHVSSLALISDLCISRSTSGIGPEQTGITPVWKNNLSHTFKYW